MCGLQRVAGLDGVGRNRRAKAQPGTGTVSRAATFTWQPGSDGGNRLAARRTGRTENPGVVPIAEPPPDTFDDLGNCRCRLRRRCPVRPVRLLVR